MASLLAYLRTHEAWPSEEEDREALTPEQEAGAYELAREIYKERIGGTMKTKINLFDADHNKLPPGEYEAVCVGVQGNGPDGIELSFQTLDRAPTDFIVGWCETCRREFEGVCGHYENVWVETGCGRFSDGD